MQAALESKMVRQRLAQFGLTDRQVQSRLSQLSDQQVHQLALQTHGLNSGGDGGGFVIGLLFITVLVLLIIFLAKRI